MGKIKNFLQHAYNVFTAQSEQDSVSFYGSGSSYGTRPDRTPLRISGERSLLAAIYTRIALDVIDVELRHVKLDDQGRYMEDYASGLDNCLNVEANIDQSALDFKLDMVLSLFERGYIALLPVDTALSKSSVDIRTMRVGAIVEWFPKRVIIDAYNEMNGRRERVNVSKKDVAIVYNPLYSVMNETNSTLMRLSRKLSLLDTIDEAAGSGRLDIIVQLPFTVRSEDKHEAAKARIRNIEMQLKGSQYGIAYIDAAEKVTQLNRPADNNLLKQVEFLTNQLYVQLGITPEVMNGTADEAAMLNYHNRTIKPIVKAFSEAMARSFLTKTARTQGQTIMYFRDIFSLVPMSVLAEISDKLTRSEVATSNELRGFIGMKPSKDPRADELRNTNMPSPSESEPTPTPEGEESQNGRPESR